jgi:argininosuccinate lyase
VRCAEEREIELAALPLPELKSFAAEIGDDVLDVLTLEGSVASRRHLGGTAPVQVREALAAALARLDAETASAATAPAGYDPPVA